MRFKITSGGQWFDTEIVRADGTHLGHDLRISQVDAHIEVGKTTTATIVCNATPLQLANAIGKFTLRYCMCLRGHVFPGHHLKNKLCPTCLHPDSLIAVEAEVDQGEEEPDAMPKFRALRDTQLPLGVYGPATMYAGDVITVAVDDAAAMQEHPDFEDFDAVMAAENEALKAEREAARAAAEAGPQEPVAVEHTTVIAAADSVKAADAAEADSG